MEGRIRNSIQRRNIIVQRKNRINSTLTPPLLSREYKNEVYSQLLQLSESNTCKHCGNCNDAMFDLIDLDKGSNDPLAKMRQCRQCSALQGVDDTLSHEEALQELALRAQSQETTLNERKTGIHTCKQCDNSNQDLFLEIVLDEGNETVSPLKLIQCAVCDKVEEDQWVQPIAIQDHLEVEQETTKAPIDLDLSYLNCIVQALNSCNACGNHNEAKFKTITLDEHRVGFDPLAMRQCMDCLSLHGADDTLSQDEAIARIQALPVELCDCGNTDSFAYILKQKEGVTFVECQVCFNEIELHISDTPSSHHDASSNASSHGKEEEISKTKLATFVPIKSMADIKKGDHIAWWKIAYWHHALVTDINEDTTVTVIEYSPTKESTLANKAKIQEHEIDLGKKFGLLYKAVYDGPCLSPDKSIERARERLHEEKYNVLISNCEHFATWCKIGDSRCKQIQEFLITLLKKSGEVVTAAALKSIRALLFVAVDDVVAEIVNRYGAVGDIVGPLVIVAVELITYGKALYDAYKLYKRGDIDKRQFITIAIAGGVKRAVRGGLAIVGTILGQIFIPIPFWGAFIGGAFGALVGQGLGMLLEWGITRYRSNKIECAVDALIGD